MRVVNTVCLLLLLSGLAAAQATIVGGTASNWAPAYGVYAAPFVPLVTTPSVTLATVSPSAAGASNATFGNVAGASNATLSIVTPPPVGVYTEPVWYGPSSSFGSATWQSSDSVGYLMANRGGSKASRTYGNQDIDQVNQKNGTVKYRGKTEHI